MTTSNKAFWLLVAGVGVGFAGYCFYFDQKRRNAPDFREKLKAKRKLQKTQNSGHVRGVVSSNEIAEMSQFFLEQIQLGQDYLSRGDIDNGLDCFGKAVLVCSEPDSLMGYLQQSLPAELFQELVARIPRIAQSLHSQSQLSARFMSAGIPELDLE